MATISEAEFAKICDGIAADRAAIIRHNPIGTDEEVLLWMLLSCLNSFLSLTEAEAPCFASRPSEETYRQAIHFVLRERKLKDFDVEMYLDKLVKG